MVDGAAAWPDGGRDPRRHHSRLSENGSKPAWSRVTRGDSLLPGRSGAPRTWRRSQARAVCARLVSLRWLQEHPVQCSSRVERPGGAPMAVAWIRDHRHSTGGFRPPRARRCRAARNVPAPVRAAPTSRCSGVQVCCYVNLAPLCRGHHRAKQASGWQLEQREPGQMVWRLPSGRAYETTGDPY